MYQVIDYNYYTKKVIIRDDELGWQEIDYDQTRAEEYEEEEEY